MNNDSAIRNVFYRRICGYGGTEFTFTILCCHIGYRALDSTDLNNSSGTVVSDIIND